MLHSEVVSGFRRSQFHPTSSSHNHHSQQRPQPPPPLSSFESHSNLTPSSNSTIRTRTATTDNTDNNSTYSQLTSPTGSQPELRNQIPGPQSPRQLQMGTENQNNSVEYTPSTSKFENIKLQATHLWTSGVDLELKQVDVPKKKAPTWLADTDFGANFQWGASNSSSSSANSFNNNNNNNTKPEINHHSQQQSTTNDTSEYPLHHTQSGPKISTTTSFTTTRSFAETASKGIHINNDDTAWSPEQEDNNVEYNQMSPPPTPYNQRPIHGFNRMGSSGPSLVSQQLNRPPYFTNPNNANSPIQNFPGVGNIPGLDRKMDSQIYQDLYVIESNQLESQTVPKFYHNLDEFLRQSPRMSTRTFGMLIKALNSISILEKRSQGGTSEKSVFIRLLPNIASFTQALHGYLQWDVLTPMELMPVLDLCSKFVNDCPRSANRIPLNLIQQSYEQIKSVFNQQDATKVKEYLYDISANRNPESGMWGTSSTPTTSMTQQPFKTNSRRRSANEFNWDLDQVDKRPQSNGIVEGWWRTMPQLPDLPDGKDLFSQIVHRIERAPNSSNKFTQDPLFSQVVNITNQAEIPNMRAYLMIQYMLLFEEMCGPVQEAMWNYLVKAKDPTNVDKSIGGCKTYFDLYMYGTTFFPTVCEPVVVLHGLNPSSHQAPREGSFAVLIRDDYRSTTSSTSNGQNETAGVLTGTIVYGHTLESSKSKRTMIIGVHLKESQLITIAWNARYTLIAADANASTIMPVLSWYHLHYEQTSDTLPTLATTLLTPASSKHSGQMDDYRDFPDYLYSSELDMSCIISQEFHDRKAKFLNKGTKNFIQWPTHPDNYQAIHPSQRPPLYSLSPTQVSAVQYALTHRVSVISGGEGTGKTYLCSKLVQLLHQALVSTQCFQPILVLTKNETTLDSILNQVIKQIPDLVRIGTIISGSTLIGHRQVIKAAAPNPTDPNRKQVLAMERKLAAIQGHLLSLWQYRQKVIEADPSIMITTIPPHYVVALQYGYTQHMKSGAQPNKEYPLEDIWNIWMGGLTKKQKECPDFPSTYQAINGTAVSETGQFIPPIIEREYFVDRCGWIERKSPRVGNISHADHWPFVNSENGSHIRMEMKHAWSSVKPNGLWDLSQEDKSKLQQRIIDALLKVIDININGMLSQQVQAAKIVEEARLQKWTSICRFSRVIGVTADFAAANHKAIESLWPRVVIMDEAQSIPESIALPFVLGSRVQHVIMVGDAHARQRPTIHNPKLKGDPKNFDVSLFERWRLGGGYMIRLEEQWRMCSDIVGIHDSLATPEADRKLLITAPIAGENKGDNCTLDLEGLEDRAYFIDYQEAKKNDEVIGLHGPYFTNKIIKTSDMDEARFLAHLALYLYQQGYKASQITVLTESLTQKALIRMAIKELMSSFTSFKFQDINIAFIDTVNNYVGKESHFVILSLAMPCGESIPEGNISLALSRARSGLYIVGRIPELVNTGWNNVVQYMKGRGLCGPQLKLHCKKHSDQVTLVSNMHDFQSIKNGGCSQLCNTLLDCGHVCAESCHHLKHTNIMCQKECNRQRPTGCNHKCLNKCYQCLKHCPPCDIVTETKRPCGHFISGPCRKLHDLIKSRPCTEIVQHTLPCGHKKQVACHQATSPKSHDIACEIIVEKALPCGHIVQQPCSYQPICAERCPERLDCGHSCPERCGMDHQLHRRAVCTASCPKQLICGHYCAKGCAKPDEHTDRCLEQCQHVCCHGYRCGRGCWEVCNECVEDCPYSCEHLQCTKKCHEKCDRPPCNEHCSKTLACGHACIGLCGESCPPCKECNPEKTCSISLRSLAEFEHDELVYMLPECGCVFAVDSLDLYFKNQAKNGEHTAIKLWQCPSCQTPIYTALRYNMYIKTEIALVNQIKAHQEDIRQDISQREKTDIIQAMNQETKTSINNIVGGRWYVCQNGHPYFIGDCGGATQISSCPQCGAVIGGLQHKVVESNRFYGEFDGSFKPAWPGQPQ
ncbi:hypothetical protein BDC45DRAFT_523409 [Circinella umbellata]|nr:hypothetical protein BDC45DRAFT_523409 [Circinella umbellata]